MNRAFGLLLFAAALGPAWAVDSAPAAPADTSAVRLTSYWRYHYAFGPPQYFSIDGRLVDTVARYASLNGGTLGSRLATPRPPADWTQPAFDDAQWCVQRAPLPFVPEVDKDGSGPYSLDMIRTVHARTRFKVPDPAAAKKVTLEIRYYGGLIAYVNGVEVVRGHIPKSEPLASAWYAEPYPPEAYGPVTPEQKAWGMVAQNGLWHPSYFWFPTYYKQRADRKKNHEAFLKFLDGARRRTLSVTLDPKILRPGINVLAIENRCSPMAEIPVPGKPDRLMLPAPCGGYSPRMAHIGLHAIALCAAPESAVASADERPAGVQCWVEDVHRWLLEEDFLEPGVKELREMTLLGGRGGACSAQVVLGCNSALGSPAAVCGALKGPNGATISQQALRVRWARSYPVRQIKADNPGSFRTYVPDLLLFRYRNAGIDVHVSSGKEDIWTKDSMRLFDRLSLVPPATIPAGTNQPVWLSVEIPRDAKAGLYTGDLRLKAEGMEEIVVAVRLQVLDFELPQANTYETYVGVDESPWALAKAANVQLWSEEHWNLIEQAVQAAGKLGARVASIPVVHNTELGNELDAMIKWIKKADGSFEFDFTRADRYLELWRAHCHRQADVIVYLVHPANVNGKGGGTGEVTVIENGKESAFSAPKADTREGLRLWTACAKAIRSHFNGLGVKDENLHWGLFYDYVGASSFALAEPLAKECPGIGWARSSHEGRKIHGSEALPGGGAAVRVTWNAAVRHFGSPPFTLQRSKGGPRYAYDATAGYQVKGCLSSGDSDRALLLPRADSDVSALGLYAPLYQLRSTQEMATSGKYAGIARICVDGWGRGGYFGPFTPYLLYPGDAGQLDGSAQFEILREGLQEMEVRIAVERAKNLAPSNKEMLDRRTERAWVLPPRPEGVRIGEYWQGWQDASWNLYAAAAQAGGGKAPAEKEKQAFFATSGK